MTAFEATAAAGRVRRLMGRVTGIQMLVERIDLDGLLAERDKLTAHVAELEQLRTARKTDDRHIDRVLAMLLLREGGRVELTAVEMQDAPAHGEFICFENLLTGGVVLAFQASDVDMSKPDRELVIGAGSPETSALTNCPTCGAPEWHEDGWRGWNPVNVECEDCAGTYEGA